MVEFKKTQLIDSAISKNLTPDNLYWKNLDFPVTTKQYGFINGLDFSPVKPYRFSVAYSTKVDIYDPSINKPCASLTRFKKGAYGGCFRRDGKLLVVGGEDGRVKLFSVDSKLMLRLFKGHQSAVHASNFLADNRHICSFSDDKTVKTWDSSTEKELASLHGHTDYVRCGAVSHQNSDVIISGSYDHTVKMWDLRQNCTDAPALSVDHGCPVEALLMFPNDALCVSAGGTTIKIWDLAAGGKQLVQLSNHRKTISSLVFCSGNRRLLSGSLDRHIKVYDLASYQVVHTMDYPAPIVKIGISQDDSVLAVAMTDCLLSIQHRLPEKAQEAKPKFSRHMSRRFLIGRSSYDEQPDSLIKEETRKRLPRYDSLLRTFQHKKALDVLLKNHYFNVRHPEIVISLLKELIRRQALEKSLSDRTDDSIRTIAKFIIKNIGKATFTSVLIDAANALLVCQEHRMPKKMVKKSFHKKIKKLPDLYGDKLQELEPSTIDVFKRLSITVNQEANQLRQMTSLMGALELILNSSSTSHSENGPVTGRTVAHDFHVTEQNTDQHDSSILINSEAAENSADLLCLLLSDDDEHAKDKSAQNGPVLKHSNDVMEDTAEMTSSPSTKKRRRAV